MKSPDHDTSPITEEDLAPAEGPPLLASDPFHPKSGSIELSEKEDYSDPSAKISYWNVRRSADQPPDFVGTLAECKAFADDIAAGRVK